LPVTSDDIRDLFRSHLAVDLNLSTNTISAYDRDLAEFTQWCHSLKLELFGIRSEKVYDYLLSLRKKGRNPATIARRLSSLKHFYRFAVGEGLCRRNPCASIEGPRLMRRLPQILDQKEMERLLTMPDTTTALGLRDSAMLETWYACGLRVSELQDLKVADVIMELRLVRVMGKGSRERLVPFGRYAQEAIEAYLATSRTALSKPQSPGNLFLNFRGQALSRMGLWKVLKKYSDKCNFRFAVTPHTIRHSCATHLIEAGADIRTVMEFLGHADISTTQIYTHLDREYLREVHRSFHPRA